MADVCGDDEPSDRYFVADELRCQLLAFGDESHCVGDLTPTREMHLCACFHC